MIVNKLPWSLRSATGGRVVKRHPKKPVPAAGDTFAVPLEGGRFAVCRVLAADERGDMVLVANADWIGRQVPDARDPALRSVLRLTHHSWGGRPSAGWVIGAPPDEFIPIGNIQPQTGEDAIPEPGTVGWPYFRIQPHEQWLWDHPEDIPPSPPPPDGRFILHRFNGDEIFRLQSAVMSAYESDGGATIWFEVESDPVALQRCEDTVKYAHWPNAEVGIEVAELNADQLVGREFELPGTKFDDEDSCMALLYYYEHEPLRENKIAILSRLDDRFWIRWTAVTQDINFYDGSKPPARVEIEGEFVFKDISKWTLA